MTRLTLFGTPISSRIALFLVAVIGGCTATARSDHEDTSRTGNAVIDCTSPNAPQLICETCNNDNTCADCLQSGDQNGSSCTDYCTANPDSTLCVKPGDCQDANGNCIQDKPGCYCMMDGSSGAGGSNDGAGGADSSSDGSDDSSTDGSADTGGDTSDDTSGDSTSDGSDTSADSGGDTSDGSGDTSDGSGDTGDFGDFARPPHMSPGYRAWLKLEHRL